VTPCRMPRLSTHASMTRLISSTSCRSLMVVSLVKQVIGLRDDCFLLDLVLHLRAMPLPFYFTRSQLFQISYAWIQTFYTLLLSIYSSRVISCGVWCLSLQLRGVLCVIHWPCSTNQVRGWIFLKIHVS
jgi:hypothetical protein